MATDSCYIPLKRINLLYKQWRKFTWFWTKNLRNTVETLWKILRHVLSMWNFACNWVFSLLPLIWTLYSPKRKWLSAMAAIYRWMCATYDLFSIKHTRGRHYFTLFRSLFSFYSFLWLVLIFKFQEYTFMAAMQKVRRYYLKVRSI